MVHEHYAVKTAYNPLTDHGLTSSFKQLCMDVTNASCSIWRVDHEQLLKVLSSMSHLPTCFWIEATIYCLDSTHPRCRHWVDLLQCSIGRLEVISIQMTLNILCETPDIPLFISPQKSSSHMWQSPILVWQHDSPLYCWASPLKWSHPVILDVPPVHSLRVSCMKVSQNSTASSTSNQFETVTAYSWAHVKSFSFSRWNTLWLRISWYPIGFNMKLECCNNNPVISCKELSTPKKT